MGFSRVRVRVGCLECTPKAFFVISLVRSPGLRRKIKSAGGSICCLPLIVNLLSQWTQILCAPGRGKKAEREQDLKARLGVHASGPQKGHKGYGLIITSGLVNWWVYSWLVRQDLIRRGGTLGMWLKRFIIPTTSHCHVMSCFSFAMLPCLGTT